MKSAPQQLERMSFSGCLLSIQLNGLNVLTIDEADFIKAVLAFVAQKERQGKEAAR
jgi:hypothetical protein